MLLSILFTIVHILNNLTIFVGSYWKNSNNLEWLTYKDSMQEITYNNFLFFLSLSFAWILMTTELNLTQNNTCYLIPMQLFV